MKILVVGTGYVGLTTGIGLAAIGHDVVCVDKDLNKINSLNNNIMPIYEPNLDELITRHKQNIKFVTSIKNYINYVDVIFLAVGTPQKLNGSVNLDFLGKAFNEILTSVNKNITVIIKSTVPVNTNNNLTSIAKEKCKFTIDVISNPEFLREGFAVHDFFNPARIVIGSNQNVKEIVEELYAEFLKKNIPIIYTDPQSAELSKYASNAFLATKVAFINEMANLCEYWGGDIDQVAHIMGVDERIGEKFLKTGPGFGGSCFPKDLLGLKYSFNSAQISNKIIDSVIESNQSRIDDMSIKIDKILKGKKPTIAVLGASYKDNTDDVRESPAIYIIKQLVKIGYNVNLYDPKAINNAREILGSSVFYFEDIQQTVKSTSAIVILTEWDEFKNFNYQSIEDIVAEKIIIDFRNILNTHNLDGWKYHSLGRKFTN